MKQLSEPNDLSGLLFGGCTLATPGAESLNLIQFQEDALETVNVGYFGMKSVFRASQSTNMDHSRANSACLGICLVQVTNETTGNSVICTTVAFRSFGDVKSELQDQANSTSSESAIQAGVAFANSAVFNVLCVAFLAYMGSLLFDLVFSISTGRNRRKLGTEDNLANIRQRQNHYRKASLFLSWTSLSIAFSAAVGITESVRALEVNLDSAISAHRGQVSLALHWLIAIISGIISLCWTLTYRAYRKVNGAMISDSIEPGPLLSYNGRDGEGLISSPPSSGSNMPILTPATGFTGSHVDNWKDGIEDFALRDRGRWGGGTMVGDSISVMAENDRARAANSVSHSPVWR